MPLGRRVRRHLARRFPRLRGAYLWILAKIRFVIGKFWGGIRKIPSTLAWSWQIANGLRRYRRTPGLKVAVDIAAFWEPLTGIGWYLFRLLENLSQRHDVKVLLFSPTIIRSPDLEEPTVEPPLGPALELVEYEISPDRVLFASTVTRILRRLEPLLIAAHGCDVMFAPNYFLPRRFSIARGALVATIHDLGFRAVPWTLREETLLELGDRLDKTLEKADRLITVSAAVRNEILQTGDADPQRVHVVHHGPGQLSSVSPGDLPETLPARFALHVGTLEPRKNIESLLECWQLVQTLMADPPILVLCGKFGWKTDRIQAEVDSASEKGWARHLGYVSETELAALYERAQVVLFPTLYEGFGLPAVEAQWAGTPLVCSDLPVLREVAGDGALFAPPDRPDLMAENVIQILQNEGLRDELVRQGKSRVAMLSWQRAAEETLAVWRLAANKPQPGNGGRLEHPS